MSSTARRLSVSLDDVRRRTAVPEHSERTGLLGGPIGKWLEDEIDYRRNMLPGVDNMWLLLAEGTDFNPVCAMLFTFKEEVNFEGVLGEWEDMTKRFPVYRQRPTGLGRRFHTVRMRDDPNFDIRRHITSARMPDGKNTKRHLEDAMAALVARDWDLGRPLWEAQVLYNYSDGQGARCALIARAHHTLSDGQGFVLSLLSTTSAKGLIERKIDAASRAPRAGRAKLSDLPVPGLARRLARWDPYVHSWLVTLLFYVLWLVFFVISILYGTYAGLKACARIATFRRRALRYDDARPPEKEFSFSDRISLADIKLVQKAFQTPRRKITLNDVMCAVVAKTIRSYIDEKGEWPDSRIALFIPISIRSMTDQSMSNQSTGMIAYFKASPRLSTAALINAAHDEMQSLKTSYWPRLLFAFLELVYRAPVLFPTNKLLEPVLACFHGVLTNVPGPQTAIDVNGSEVMGWTVSPPQAGKGTLGLGMISYNGGLVWTCTADHTEKHAGVARALTEGFCRTFDEFLAEAREIVKDD